MPQLSNILNAIKRIFSNYAVLSIGIILCIAAIFWNALRIYNSSDICHVSGAWLTLASDFANGIFYRDLYDNSTGFGGTRFFPLLFIMQSGIFFFGMDTLVGAHLVSIGIGVLFLVLLVKFMFRLTGDRAIVFVLLGLLFFTKPFIMAVGTARGDLLPVLLNIVGIYFVLYNKSQIEKRLLIATIFFLSALSAKFTSINGITSVVIWLWMQGDKRLSIKLSVIYTAGVSLMLVFFYVSSGGRFLEIFTTCATADTSLYFILSAPVRFVTKFSPYDFFSTVLFLWALFYSRNNTTNSPEKSLVFWYFVTSIIQTVIVYSSPGTIENHLIDMVTASLLFIAIHRNEHKFYRKDLVPFWMGIFCLLAAIGMMRHDFNSLLKGKGRYPTELISFLNNYNSILSENPTIPLIAGKTVFLQDAFMYRLFVKTDKTAEAEMHQLLSKKKFEVIVLMYNAAHPFQTNWYSEIHFGSSFIELLNQNYRYSKQIGEHYIYLPNGSIGN